MAYIYGTNNRDVLYGSSVGDAIYGYAGNDYLNGLSGNDLLDGGSGADSMIGGTGNDSYYVDSMTDTVTELVGQGTDTVISYVDTNIQWLPSNVENLTLSGNATYGDGNNLNNVIKGTNRVNNLYGYDGHDILNGYGDNDVLLGGNGNDKLDGGSGADYMMGGTGNDSYYVDDNPYNNTIDNQVSDTIIESENQGIDTVFSYVDNYMGETPLASNVENLTLMGTAVSGSGNNLDNEINGTNSNNFLTGDDGNDILRGMNGDDVIAGNYGDDKLFGGAGNDFLNGDTLGIYDGGNDIIDGGLGNDYLIGGALENIRGAQPERDKFVLAYRGYTNADVLSDFNHQYDTIMLNNSLDAGILDGAINPGIKGLFFTGGNFLDNILEASCFFIGPGLTGNNNLSQSSGIYVNTTAGENFSEIWYNPTNNNLGDVYEHFDAEIIGRVSHHYLFSLDHTDFVYGG